MRSHLLLVCAASLALSAAGPVDISGRKTCVVGRELNVDRREFSGLARSAEYRRATKSLIFLLRSPATNLERRPDWPGCDPIHANTLRTKLFS